MTRPASGAASPLSSTRRRSMYQLARCPDDSTKSPCTTAFSLITRRRSSRSLTVGEPTQRPAASGAQAVPALGGELARPPVAAARQALGGAQVAVAAGAGQAGGQSV